MFTAHSACPTSDNPTAVPGTYQVLPPAPDARVEYAEATGCEAGAKAMLTALQQAGVQVPLPVLNDVARPLVQAYHASARAIVATTMDEFNSRYDAQLASTGFQQRTV